MYILRKLSFRPNPLRLLLKDDVRVISVDKGSLQLYAEFTPIRATYQDVKWTIESGSEIATINSVGLLKARGTENGEVIVKAESKNESDISSTITITLDNQLSVIDHFENKFKVYPNPATSEVYVENIDGQSVYSAEILDTAGRILMEDQAQNGQIILDISNLQNGIYMVKVVMHKGEEYVKIVKR